MALYAAALKFGNGCELPKIDAIIHPLFGVFPLLRT
jgi:hypothetical protein